MIYCIKNECLEASFNRLGGELISLKDKEGTEYLWQGNPEYWSGQAPVLFPWIGRLTEGKYSYKNKEYFIEKHGFARKLEFVVSETEDMKIVFTLQSSPDTLEVYPFEFVFSIIYELQGDKLVTTYEVENQSETSMYFAIGGHPGFNVPLETGVNFEDYYLEFPNPERTYQVTFSENYLVSGEKAYELEEGNKISLTHGLFDDDAIILRGMGDTVTLKSKQGKKSITVSASDMPYLGFWHMPETDAPYVCIEPWSSLPSREGVVEELEQKEDLVSLEVGGVYRNTWEICIRG